MQACHEITFRRGLDRFLLRREVVEGAAIYGGYRNGVPETKAWRKEEACRELLGVTSNPKAERAYPSR